MMFEIVVWLVCHDFLSSDKNPQDMGYDDAKWEAICFPEAEWEIPGRENLDAG